MTGYPWATGDALLAADLNAAIANSGWPGGPFLSLSGGTHSIAESGAAGNGVTDDQPSIQAWLNTLTAGAEVLLQPGGWYYIHAAPLTIPNGIVVRGSYNALDNNNTTPGTFLHAGGFLIDPSLATGLIMSSASSLRQCKVYRYGLVANVSDAAATTAKAAWAAEAVYRQTNGAMTNGATVIPLASTTGITAGMRVTGPGGLGYGGNTATVTAINPGVSVTISVGVNAAQPIGTYFRFGASVGITVPYNASGVVLEELTVIGFRTGIQTFPGQYFIARTRGDNVTNIEACHGGDVAVVRDCEFMPLYGTTAVQAGDSIFVHDGLVTVLFTNMFTIGWQTGWHFANTPGSVAANCGSESIDGAGYVGFYLESVDGVELRTCHAEAAAIGFHVKNSGRFIINGCSSSSGPSVAGNNVAHFWVENTGGYTGSGSIINPVTSANYPQKAPFLFAGGGYCDLINPVIRDIISTPTVPFVQGTLQQPNSPVFIQGISYSPGVPPTGWSTAAAAYWNGIVVDSSGTITSATITLPPRPMDGQTFRLVFNVAVTTLTINTSDGSAVGNHGSPTAGSQQEWLYIQAANKWFCGG